MKLKTLFVLYIIIPLAFVSCQQKSDNSNASYNYSLQETGKKLSLETVRPHGVRFTAVFPFTDKKGERYLTFQETLQNNISIYEFHTGNFFKTVKIEREGPNSITQLHGYFIKDFDEIYLTNPNLPFVARTDTTGQIFQKISFEKSDDGTLLIPYFSSTHYTPLAMINDTFYVTQVPPPWEEPNTWPVSCYVDTLNKSVKKLPFNFPQFLTKEERNLMSMGIGIEFAYNRCFDGSNFIYSFYIDESIRVTSTDHQEIKQIPVKSKYIKKVISPRETKPDDMLLGAKRLCEAPFYGDLIYDPYRSVYYRVAWPETEMEEEEGRTYIEIWTTGRKRFSIIILDKDFNIIGETLFPDYKYYSRDIFVEKEGLYIRSNHFKSPDYNDNKLEFTCFELVKN